MIDKPQGNTDARIAASGGAKEIARQAENFATGRAIRTDKPEAKNDPKQDRNKRNPRM